MSMEVGIEFGYGVSGSSKMSYETSQSTKKAAEQTYGYTTNNTIEVSCPTPNDPINEGVGYWVFRVTNADKTTKATQALGVCRYGAGRWNKAPECPFAACIDSQCTQCRDWKA